MGRRIVETWTQPHRYVGVTCRGGDARDVRTRDDRKARESAQREYRDGRKDEDGCLSEHHQDQL